MVSYASLVKEKVITVLQYVDTKTIAPASGAAHHVFRLNSIFDPDVTGVGHQPAYHDQWSALYNKYRVLSATWKIVFKPARAFLFAVDGLGGGMVDGSHYDQQRMNHIVTWEVNNTSTAEQTAAADLNILRETGRTANNFSWAYLPRGGATLKGSASIRTILSGPDDFNKDISFGSNPSNVAHLIVGAMSKDGNPSVEVKFDIYLSIKVLLSDPIQIGES